MGSIILYSLKIVVIILFIFLIAISVICVGRGVGSGGFSCRLLSKAGEGWIESSMGMARYAGGMQADSVLFMSIVHPNMAPNIWLIISYLFILIAKNYFQTCKICEIGSSMEPRVVVNFFYAFNSVQSTLACRLSFCVVEGSLSSSRRMKRGEDSKLKSSRATERSSEHHLQALHAGESHKIIFLIQNCVSVFLNINFPLQSDRALLVCPFCLEIVQQQFSEINICWTPPFIQSVRRWILIRRCWSSDRYHMGQADLECCLWEVIHKEISERLYRRLIKMSDKV